jgi:hypothetical protein
LGDLASLGLGGALTGFRFGVALVEEARVDGGLRELWAPLELRGSEVLGATLVASGVRGLSAFGDSPLG